ncbi:Lymphoid-specific helicase [Choanephora cucurbitarum]|uniref:Proliferation-associated SNF2-like protein n=1 Tax=Choanephora cucurbitarum TaxID=101091 RepID=A0A1C7NN29_9FUNG|nr:Lymphoid-specific helicase [Choanephora cucurbitarum]
MNTSPKDISEPTTRDVSLEIDTPQSVSTDSPLQPASIASDQDIENIQVKDEYLDAGLSENIIAEEKAMEQNTMREQDKIMKEAQAQFDTTVKDQRMKRLNFLLEKSGAYATILGRKLAKQQEEARERAIQLDNQSTVEQQSQTEESKKPATRGRRGRPVSAANAKKRKTTDANYDLTDYLNEDDIKRRKQADGSVVKAIVEEQSTQTKKPKTATETVSTKPSISARQPALVTGAVLRDYQLAGVEWLISLWENGLNGILADEMGLGKTLQTIGFIAHLKSMQVSGPYLIVTPLSTLANWVNEFKRFAPSINVLLYHGSKEERHHLINRKMQKKKETSYEFPIIITSYEIVMNDRKHLQKYNWKYIVVDEGHRLKNMNCRLIRELKTYSSANRLLLTGTPLQNNLSELWSLLNFLLPDIFDDLDMFQSWFDFSDINDKSGQDRIIKEEEEDKIVSSLHTILRPFLLRRLKTDVEYALPKKKEYLLYAPLTQPQKNLYDAIIKRDLRDYLIKRKTVKDKTEQPEEAEIEEDNRRSKKKEVSYKEKSDRQFFKDLEKEPEEPKVDEDALARTQELAQAVKQVNGLHLQNLVMQLRKVCNHPFLFDWPIDPATNTPILSHELAAQSGKVLLLDRLLTGLFDRGHKVLVFSQMTKMLDILEDWATHLKGWPICRLDGSVSQEDRRRQIEEFSDPRSEIKLFLLSTRAGGLGINLTAADTVIIFDSDWNPQMDLQAQDRVHRIGQTKPVLIYRFVAAKTVEAKILERATAKRKLEKLVISKDKFKTPVASAKRAQESTISDLAEILASEDGEQVQIVAEGDKVISDADLEKLLDRSPSVFESGNTSDNELFREMDASEMHDERNEILATRS